MKKKFTEEQIAFALKQAETATPVVEMLRKMGITEQTYYRWNGGRRTPCPSLSPRWQ
jgi:hypothetical protein